MSHDQTSMTTNLDRPNAQYSDHVGGAMGVTVFAGLLMIMTGVFHVIQGLVALFNDEFYVVGSEYVFQFDVTAWGWIHLGLGLLVGFAGVALFRGAVWARTVAVIMACLSIVASFAWLPYYPVWSIAVIVFGVLVIWAATVYGPNLVDD
ncbi:MAG: hypothetical protein WCA30_13940 [Dermatophilaceae bacterium]